MSLRRTCTQTSVVAVLIGLLAGLEEVSGQDAPKRSPADGLRTEGPFQNQNLAIYLVRGKQTDARRYITLDEAMREKTVVLREQGAGRGQDSAQVNELEIQNKSDKWLYIQAGDVIEGGKQDRTIGTDVAIPPHSPPQPISAFCVEHGRWTPRSASGLAFQSNPAIVGNTRLKRSIQGEKSQPGVWAEVSREDAMAREAVTVGGESSAVAFSSTGTYNAIVQNSGIRAGRADYVNSLLPQIEKAGDAVGFVVAVNGEITAADVYGSSALFHKLARKLVESYALEALLARNASRAMTEPPGKAAALSFLIDVSKATGKGEKVTPSIQRTTRETQGAVLYEYTEFEKSSAGAGKLLHKSIVKK